MYRFRGYNWFFVCLRRVRVRTRGAEDVWSGWNCVLTEVVVALLIAKGCDTGVERSSCRVE